MESGYEAARAYDGDPQTRWASAFEARSGWLEIDLGQEQNIGSVLVSEIEWKETREFAIEVKRGDAWMEVAHGTTIGTDRKDEFRPVTARCIRLNIIHAGRRINISEFQVFAPD